jgi:hypothetical protein
MCVMEHICDKLQWNTPIEYGEIRCCWGTTVTVSTRFDSMSTSSWTAVGIHRFVVMVIANSVYGYEIASTTTLKFKTNLKHQ